MATTPKHTGHLITITREFNAPRKLVWEAWTQPEHIAQWWGPKGMETRVVEQDFRPGGNWRYAMKAPNGMEYPVIGTFREIVEYEKIVSIDEFGEEYQEFFDASKLPNGVVMTFLFEDIEDKTRLTIHIAHANEADKQKHEKMNVIAGWNSSFDRLDEHLAQWVA